MKKSGGVGFLIHIAKLIYPLNLPLLVGEKMSKVIKSLMQISVAIVVGSMIGGCSDNSEAPKQEISTTPPAQQVEEIKVIKWGPQGTVAGKGFSVQSNGDSAIWFEFSGPGHAQNLEVWFGDQKLSGVAIIPGKGGSAQIPPTLLDAPKKVPVYLVYKVSGKKIEIGIFEITAQ